MMGAVNMKMMSSTSTTSTNGVMLISESELCVRPWELVNAIKTYFANGVAYHCGSVLLRSTVLLCRCLSLFQNDAFAHSCSLRGRRGTIDRVQKFEAEVVHSCAEFANLLHVLVVGDDRRNGGKQSSGGGDERGGNSWRYRAQGCRAGVAQSLKGIDNPPHGAKQANKGRNRPRGCKPGKTRLHLRHLFRRRDLNRALDRGEIARRARPALAAIFVVSSLEHAHQGTGFELL